MVTEPNREPDENQVEHNVDAGGVFFTFAVPQASVTLIRADDIVVEESETRRLLMTRNGDFLLYKRVFLVVDGRSKEITVDPPFGAEQV